ncbi:MAG TPA: GH25 family lysozyme [Bacillota bacterium]|nr:GH25 family lysozyme [Bacillota bacterium]
MKKWVSFIVSLMLFVGTTIPTYAMELRDQSNIQGIDVSHWNGNINWSQVKESGVKFAYLKATEGTGVADPQFGNFVKEAQSVGIQVGAFHYAKPTAPYDSSEPVKQAKFFVETLQSILSTYGDIMPVLDLEETGGLTPSELSSWARIFTNTIKQLTNRQVMLYISEDFFRENDELNQTLSDLPLWASYWDQYYQGKNPPDIAGWQKWMIWQYSGQGVMRGITTSVDLDAGPPSIEALRGELPTIITLHLGSTQATKNGQPMQLDATPFTILNRTMVPIRFIAESLGAEVSWNPATQTITISKPGTLVVFTLGLDTAIVNGKTVSLDVSAQLSSNRTFVPLRFISENLGMQVDFNPVTQSILLSSEK